ncbi:MAG TPA: hypothetical protein VHN80_32275, partial [Kineosporiaceae bacterium]|nr:hypothetical protein [Kineosporiaceae bacterium]
MSVIMRRHGSINVDLDALSADLRWSASLPSRSSPQAALCDLIQSQRARRSDQDRLAVAQGLRDVFLEHFLEPARSRRAGCVAVYESDWGDPATQLLRAALAARPITTLISRQSARGDVAWILDPQRGQDAPRSQGKLPRPAPLDEVEIALIPALAVDTVGNRLAPPMDGYRHLLHQLPHNTQVLAAVHDDEIYDAALGPLPIGPDGGI